MKPCAAYELSAEILFWSRSFCHRRRCSRPPHHHQLCDSTAIRVRQIYSAFIRQCVVMMSMTSMERLKTQTDCVPHTVERGVIYLFCLFFSYQKIIGGDCSVDVATSGVHKTFCYLSNCRRRLRRSVVVDINIVITCAYLSVWLPVTFSHLFGI